MTAPPLATYDCKCCVSSVVFTDAAFSAARMAARPVRSRQCATPTTVHLAVHVSHRVKTRLCIINKKNVCVRFVKCRSCSPPILLARTSPRTRAGQWGQPTETCVICMLADGKRAPSSKDRQRGSSIDATCGCCMVDWRRLGCCNTTKRNMIVSSRPLCHYSNSRRPVEHHAHVSSATALARRSSSGRQASSARERPGESRSCSRSWRQRAQRTKSLERAGEVVGVSAHWALRRIGESHTASRQCSITIPPASGPGVTPSPSSGHCASQSSIGEATVAGSRRRSDRCRCAATARFTAFCAACGSTRPLCKLRARSNARVTASLRRSLSSSPAALAARSFAISAAACRSSSDKNSGRRRTSMKPICVVPVARASSVSLGHTTQCDVRHRAHLARTGCTHINSVTYNFLLSIFLSWL